MLKQIFVFPSLIKSYCICRVPFLCFYGYNCESTCPEHCIDRDVSLKTERVWVAARTDMTFRCLRGVTCVSIYGKKIKMLSKHFQLV